MNEKSNISNNENETFVSFYVFCLSLIIYAFFWFVPSFFPFAPKSFLSSTSFLFLFIGVLGCIFFFGLLTKGSTMRFWVDQAIVLFLLFVMTEFILSSFNFSSKSPVDIEREKIQKSLVEELIAIKGEGLYRYHHILINYLVDSKYLTGFENQNIVFQEEDDGLIRFAADENGFRNDPGVYTNSKVFDFVTLGDSFAHGCCVNDGYTFADRLESISGKSVYNMGYSGTGLLYSLAAYMEYARVKNNKYIVVQILEGASYSRVKYELKSKKYDRYLNAAKNGEVFSNGLAEMSLKEKDEKEKFLWDVALNAALTKLIKEKEKNIKDTGNTFFYNAKEKLRSLSTYKFVYHIKNVLRTKTTVPETEKYPKCDDYNKGTDSYNAVTDILSYFADEAKSNGGNLVLVFQPSFRWIKQDFPECERKFYKEFSNNSDALFVDLVDHIDKQGNPFQYYYSLLEKGWPHAHFNQAGYDFAAHTVVEEMGLDIVKTEGN
jgi:hypothetical protein